METNPYRRTMLKAACAGAALQCLPGPAVAQSWIRIRQEWQQFKKTARYQSFLKGIAAMRANTNPSDRGSLHYWANVHVNYCPHGAPYFIAWHRGYLYFFEQQLRIAAGDPDLNLPYWNYYANPTMPAEFTDPTPGNPLYLQRMGANVYNALSMTPFSSYNFQRGTSNAFETGIETMPHDPVHNLIGGIMATMESPLDPIFYLHHANIDRLTHAWALPDGKGIPVSAYPYSSTNSSIYWAGNHVYATDLSIERYKTLIPTWVDNDYDNDTLPAALPPLAVTAQASSTRLASPRLPSDTRPAFKPFTPVQGSQISETRRSLAGAAQLAFDEQSVSYRLTVNPRDAADIGSTLAIRQNPARSTSQSMIGSIKIVVDRALLSDAGRLGGYFYALYLNMPPAIGSQTARERAFVTTLGAFQIAGASHHGPARLEFDVTDLLAQQQMTDFSALSLSWVRVDGDKPPAGRTLTIDEVRIELSYEVAPVQAPPLPKPKDWYQAASRRGKS